MFIVNVILHSAEIEVSFLGIDQNTDATLATLPRERHGNTTDTTVRQRERYLGATIAPQPRHESATAVPRQRHESSTATRNATIPPLDCHEKTIDFLWQLYDNLYKNHQLDMIIQLDTEIVSWKFNCQNY